MELFLTWNGLVLTIDGCLTLVMISYLVLIAKLKWSAKHYPIINYQAVKNHYLVNLATFSVISFAIELMCFAIGLTNIYLYYEQLEGWQIALVLVISFCLLEFSLTTGVQSYYRYDSKQKDDLSTYKLVKQWRKYLKRI